MKFTDLGLSEPILEAITASGYDTPTPIQAQAIPCILEGKDLLAAAQTGTGKTAGFTLPILHRLTDKSKKGPSEGRPPVRALVLTPTRELAAQVDESVKTYGQFLKLTSFAMFGGVSINPQIKALKSRVDILVATPGRLLDHVRQGTLDLSKVEILVLDEADRMLDMGFIRDIRKILELLPTSRQNLLFSATFSDDIKNLASSFLSNPETIEVARRNTAAETVQQEAVLVNKEDKRHLLTHLIKSKNWFQVLVFTRTKHGANALTERLLKAEIPTLAIHGNKSQGARTRALSEFKSGKLQVLVATDIAARGLDIDQLPHVVNYELPSVAEDYVHRIGRTGRAGAEGSAISLVAPDERKALQAIEKMMGKQIPLAQYDFPKPEASERPSRAPKPALNKPRTNHQKSTTPAEKITREVSAPSDAPKTTTKPFIPKRSLAAGNNTHGTTPSRDKSPRRKPR
ncbi:DEAD/DEAH box helicase [Leeia sp. TBRC 13508]|uniref:DEAD/DEAH box helicase n=1 Tax=Leeia speluncae TaxID=2884804 RepID=A0ABS8D7J3_9NEIS|nr:DEAD/DEAH box helicase [Leeia speluncae]MCB6184165.1 DEAD/DEAH box helicase [Leeia speluncae]